MKIILSILLIVIIITNGEKINDNHDEIVRCITTKGKLDIKIYYKWSPIGAKHFIKLIKDNFYTNIGFFRVVKTFLTQFGISPIKEMNRKYSKRINDDPSLNITFKRGYLSYAGGGANSRTTQLFITFRDSKFLGKTLWETPFGVVNEDDMKNTLDKIYEIGDLPPWNKKGAYQHLIHKDGNNYLKKSFPQLDYILNCTILEKSTPKPPIIIEVPKSSQKTNILPSISEDSLKSSTTNGDDNKQTMHILVGLALFILLCQLYVYLQVGKAEKRNL